MQVGWRRRPAAAVALALALALLLAGAPGAQSTEATGSWCAFHPNGLPDRGIHVDVGHDGNAALLNSSLLLLASRLNQLDPHKPREFELRAPDGTPVADVRECARRGGHLYLVRRGDLWVYPALAVNATTAVTVATDGEPRTYTVRALAKRPKIFEVPGFLTAPETAHLRAQSGLNERHDGFAAMTPEDDDVVMAVQQRLAALLRLPEYLVNIGSGARVRVAAARPEQTSGVFVANRDFSVLADYPDRRDLARGRNCFVTATVFLTTVRTGGELNFPLSDNPAHRPDVRSLEDPAAASTLLVPPGLRVCAEGVLAAPEEGKLVFYYSLLPDGQDRGEPDMAAFYAFCNPVSSARWTATWAVMSKTWYDTSLFLFRWTDAVLGRLFDLSLEKILTDGYGWDWAEDDGTFPAVSDAELSAALARDLPGPYQYIL